MPSLPADAFWELLASSGLVEPTVVPALRQAFAARPPAEPRAGQSGADSRSIAAWLAETGVLTRWQARRLGHGDRGPFVVGGYRLLERHEFPGTALHFTARHVPSGRAVGLVRLDPQACRRPEVWEAIVRRTESAGRMSDPTLSRTWALEQVGSHRLIVCERIDGEPLAAELDRRGPFPPGEAGATTLRIAAAVAELHAAGGVHGSLSLDTVLRPRGAGSSPAAGVRVLQFPLAGDPQRIPHRPPLDTAEQIAACGRRAAFVAPELTLPGAVCDPRSDVYAIGCILHALVTGAVPGWAGDPRETLRAAATLGLPALGPPVPPEVATLVSYLAARDPAGRYPNAVDAAAAIATCFGLAWAPPAAGRIGVEESAFVFEPPTVTVTAPRIAVPASAPRRGRSPRPRAAAAGERPADHEAWFWKLMAWMFGLFFATTITAVTIGWGMRAGKPDPRPRGGMPGNVDGAGNLPRPPAAAAVAPKPARPAAPPPTFAGAADLPWVSPTSGLPPRLDYLPPGAQLVLVARPAALAGDAEGARLLAALGPDVAAALAEMTAVCGHAVDGVDRVEVAWQGGAAGGVTAVAVLHLAPGRTVPDDAGFRSRAWQAGGIREVAGGTVHAGRLGGADAAFWLPDRDRGRVLVIAPPDRIAAVVAAAADGPQAAGAALPPPLETLLGMLDGTRHVTLFGMSHFLATSGRALFTGALAPLAEPVSAFLGDDVQAAAVSLHVGAETYAEIDVVAPRDVPVARLAARLVADLRRIPAAVEDACTEGAAGGYGRKLVQRLPGMLRMLTATVRGAGEGGGVVLNARLPRSAAHNIALAAEIALARPPAAGAGRANPELRPPAAPTSLPAAPGSLPAAPTSLPAAPVQQDARARLRRTITLSFASDTLERSIQMLSEEIGVPMEILGGDLELEGITRNQSFGLDEVDRPAEAVLLAILAKADRDGKLAWVIRDRAGVETIEITTRAAAERRGDPVPPRRGPP